MRRIILFVLAALLMVASVSCGGAETKSQPSPSPTGRLSSTATVAIVEPATDDVIRGSDVPVKIALTGGRIVPQVSANLKPDEGHVHLLLDGKVVQLLGSLDETISDVAQGRHLLQVEFVAADHGPFSPRVIAAVSFTVA